MCVCVGLFCRRGKILHHHAHKKTTTTSQMTRRNVQVFLLYRRCLRELQNNVDRETLCVEARKVRNEFESYRGEQDQGKVQFLIDRANYWLDQVRHSEPYVRMYHSLSLSAAYSILTLTLTQLIYNVISTKSSWWCCIFEKSTVGFTLCQASLEFDRTSREVCSSSLDHHHHRVHYLDTTSSTTTTTKLGILCVCDSYVNAYIYTS